MNEDLFFDTDCLSAFLWINNTNILEKLYGGDIIIPSPVYSELSNPRIPHIKNRADILINSNVARLKQIESDTDEYELYCKLVKGTKNDKAIGKGEAAGIALAKTYNGILASNNWKDIAIYIERYNLKHIDTGKILKEALEKKIITVDEGDDIWRNMLARNRRLPTSTFAQYLKEYK
ncbi:MAG: hypothetical protein ACRC7V_04925 [Lachnospiraceae bacterium]